LATSEAERPDSILRHEGAHEPAREIPSNWRYCHRFPSRHVQESANSRASNRSKADQDPATWLPSAEGYRCRYATNWVADKTRWGLSIDATEQTALARILEACPDETVTVVLAR
jgi:hypothetical protein